MDEKSVLKLLVCGHLWTISVKRSLVFGYLRPTENIVTDAAKEPGNFMQVIAIDIIGSERLGLGNGQ